jgi:hypothetical protein
MMIAALVLVSTPIAGEAQQAPTMHRIGVLLHHGTPPGFLAMPVACSATEAISRA